MNGAKGIAGISVLAIAIFAFMNMTASHEVKENQLSQLMEVERIRQACEWADLKGEKEDYKLCKQRLAKAEEILAGKSALVETRVAGDVAEYDALADAAAAEMKTQSNGKVDLEAARAARLAELPD